MFPFTKVFIRLLFAAVAFALTACAHRQPSSVSRCIAGAEQCRALWREGTPLNANDVAESDYLALAIANEQYGADAVAGFVENELADLLSAPIPMSPIMQQYRREVLAHVVANPDQREQFVRLAEAEMRVRSEDVLTQIEAGNNQYDYVIVGGGIHGVISAARIKERYPNARVLIVEGSDTAAANFRVTGMLFRINSSNRASGSGRVPLPGLGNINELPGLPIQVSDWTGAKYPEASDLGNAGVMAMHALVTRAGVDVVFRTIATESRPESGQRMVSLATLDRRALNVNGRAIIRAVGLGVPNNIQALRSLLFSRPDVFRPSRATARDPQQPPKVMSFEDAFRYASQSMNPRGPFAGKKVAIIGKGDSANVFLEFLIGYGPDAAYQLSTAQVGLPSRIVWVGQDANTCEAVLQSFRSRYTQLQTLFRSSSQGMSALGIGTENLLENVQVQDNGQFRLLLRRPREGGFVGTPSDDYQNVDYIIYATGYEQTWNTADQLAGYTNVLSQTAVSGGRSVVVGRQSSDGREILVGPGAGRLPSEGELLGIVQNFVSIFNNAPRTVAAVDALMNNVVPQSIGRIPQVSAQRLLINPSPGNNDVVVEGLEDIRSIRRETEDYLRTVLLGHSTRLVITGHGELNITFRYDETSDRIVVASPGFNITPLVESLAETRDFFNTLRFQLRFGRSNVLRARLSSRDETVTVRSVALEEDRVAVTLSVPTPDSVINPGLQILRAIDSRVELERERARSQVAVARDGALSGIPVPLADVIRLAKALGQITEAELIAVARVIKRENLQLQSVDSASRAAVFKVFNFAVSTREVSTDQFLSFYESLILRFGFYPAPGASLFDNETFSSQAAWNRIFAAGSDLRNSSLRRLANAGYRIPLSIAAYDSIFTTRAEGLQANDVKLDTLKLLARFGLLPENTILRIADSAGRSARRREFPGSQRVQRSANGIRRARYDIELLKSYFGESVLLRSRQITTIYGFSVTPIPNTTDVNVSATIRDLVQATRQSFGVSSTLTEPYFWAALGQNFFPNGADAVVLELLTLELNTSDLTTLARALVGSGYGRVSSRTLRNVQRVNQDFRDALAPANALVGAPAPLVYPLSDN